MGKARAPVTWGRPGSPAHGTGRRSGDVGQSRAPEYGVGQDVEPKEKGSGRTKHSGASLLTVVA